MPQHKPPPYIASVRARRLARSLRDARTRARISAADAAARLGWSQGKVSHTENHRNKPSVNDVEALLDLYGVTTPDREVLLTLARDAERRGWWTDYNDVIGGPYIPLEDEANEICDWAPQVIPGLLQTPEYAREIFRKGFPDAAADDIDRRLRARTQRQMLLRRARDAPHLHVVLDEAVLERPLGGAEVMRDQLYKLAAEARRSNVTIQVLPRSAGSHAGLDGPFILLRFAEPADPDVVYVEGVHGAVYLESPQQIAQCNVRFEELCDSAFSPDKSAALIDAAARRQ